MDDFHWTIAFGGRDDWNAVLWMRWKMRLTDVDKLIEIAHRIRLDSRERIEQMIESAPTVDPVKHGYWELSPFDGNWACSNCGNKPYHDNMKNMNYCPNCGYKMDEVKKSWG